MKRTLTWSAAAMAAALFLWQAGTALADPALVDELRPAYVLQQQAAGKTVVLKVASPQSGPNILRVRVEAAGAVDTSVQQVTLYPKMPGHEMLLLTGSVPTTRTDDGEFRADTGVFEMFGTWDLVVETEGPGGTETAAFAFQLAPSRPQIVLFAGVPLSLLALGLLAVIVLWRRSTQPAVPASAGEEGGA